MITPPFTFQRKERKKKGIKEGRKRKKEHENKPGEWKRESQIPVIFFNMHSYQIFIWEGAGGQA